ncbi:hypothetical protein [Brevibacterium litoralis]|uniref:hypothetical protein n=1 Tax=Brevibacterium litoralis TaxID=3138935 RepID=UPI0032EC6271
MTDDIFRILGARPGSPGGSPSGSRDASGQAEQGGADGPVRGLQCSAKACRADASHAMLWNNPRIHTPERRKVWLACPDHRGYLREYLEMRSLFKDEVTVDAIPESAG